jgi:hypothetical protein
MRADVKVTHPEVGDLELQTGDISDGGAYIITKGEAELKLGEIVTVQVQGMGSGEAPLVKMRIVRADKGGVGLEFVSPDES